MTRCRPAAEQRLSDRHNSEGSKLRNSLLRCVGRCPVSKRCCAGFLCWASQRFWSVVVLHVFFLECTFFATILAACLLLSFLIAAFGEAVLRALAAHVIYDVIFVSGGCSVLCVPTRAAQQLHPNTTLRKA